MSVRSSRISRFSRFHSVSSETRDEAASLFVERTFEKGETLLRQGAASETFVLIDQGYVKWERTGPHSSLSLLDVYGPCETPGELAVQSGGAYPASALALTAVSALCLSRSSYNTSLFRDIRFVENTTRCLSDRAFSLLGRVESGALPDVKHRLGAFIYRLTLKFGELAEAGRRRVPFSLNRQDFANAVNCRRETVARTLGAWQKSGDLRIEERGLSLSEEFFTSLERICGSRHTYFGSECTKCRARTGCGSGSRSGAA